MQYKFLFAVCSLLLIGLNAVPPDWLTDTGHAAAAGRKTSGPDGTPVPETAGPISLGEALDNTTLTWATGGDADWFGQTDVYQYGGDAAKTGIFYSPAGGITSLTSTVNGAGTLSFYWKSVAGTAGATLQIKINGTLKDTITGETDWQYKTYTLSSTGSELEWVYQSAGPTEGNAAAYVDQVIFTPAITTTTTTTIPTTTTTTTTSSTSTTTTSVPPTVFATTKPATYITGNCATFNGEVVGGIEGQTVDTWFEYGQSLAYGRTTTPRRVFFGSGSSPDIPKSFAIEVQGLECQTDYHVRAVAFLKGGTSYGADIAFSTASCPASTTTSTTTTTIPCLPVSILVHPSNKIIHPGNRATLTVAADGPPALHYQWYQGEKGNTALPVGSGSAVLNTPPLTGNASFWVRVSSDCGSAADSEAGRVSVLSNPPITDLAAYYPFNGNAKDESYHGNDCTVSGPVPATDRFGKTSSAFTFSGTGGTMIKEQPSFSFGSRSVFTFSLWACFASLHDGQEMLSHQTSNAGNFGWRLGIQGGRLEFAAVGQQGIWFPCQYPVANMYPGIWYHLAGIYDQGEMALFVNGSRVGSTSLTLQDLPVLPAPISIGARYAGQGIPASDFFNGQADEIRIYGRELSEDEIFALYAANGFLNLDFIAGTMWFVKAGTFSQGRGAGDPCDPGDSNPFTHVLTRNLVVMETEVTRQMWMDLQAVQPDLPPDPSHTAPGQTTGFPVNNPSWREAVLFANLLSVQNRLTPCYYSDANCLQPVAKSNYLTTAAVFTKWNATGYRLPTEGEWEYCCRGGSITPFSLPEPEFTGCQDYCTAGHLPALETVAWFCANNTPAGTKPAGQKLPNSRGLRDLHGNVWEWCWDYYTEVYPAGTSTDYHGPDSGTHRVIRGGSCSEPASNCRSAFRGYLPAEGRDEYTGFRLVRYHRPDFSIGGLFGVGVLNPERALHLRGNNAVFRMDRTAGASAFLMERTDATGNPQKGFLVGTEASAINTGQFIFRDMGTSLADGEGIDRLVIANDGTAVFSGSLKAKRLVSSSSMRWKEGIRGLTAADAPLSLLHGVRFRWRLDGTPDVGLIAEEVGLVVPEAVRTDPVTGAPGVDYGKLLALLLQKVGYEKEKLDGVRELREDIRQRLEQLARKTGIRK